MSRKFQCKAIPSTWIEKQRHRLDCGPYMSGGMEARELLRKLPVKKDHLQDLTGGISGIVNAGRINRVWVDDPAQGFPFLSSTDILQADFSCISHIAKSVARQNAQLLIKERWILITRSGTIGRMTYSRADMNGMACTEDVLRIIPDENAIKPGYIYSYLSSKFGLPIVISGTYGSIITHLEPHHIADLPVPRLGEVEDKTHDLVQRAADNLFEHQRLLDEATRQVFVSCGIEDQSRYKWLNDNSDQGFCVSSKEMNGIFRALNHSRRADQIKRSIKSIKHNELGELIDLEWLRWRVMFKRILAEPEFGIEVITQRPLFDLVPEGKWISRGYLLNLSTKYIVPDETILIAKQGTLGEHELYCRCEFITGDRALARAYSDHCMRIVVKDKTIHPGYLFAYLRSEAAFRLLRSLSEGSKQQDLHWRTVPSLLVPRNNSEVETEIGENIRKAYLLRNRAVDMFEKARTLVERAIEEGGR